MSAARYTAMGISYDLSFYNRGIWPLADDAYNLGTSSNKYADCYLGNNPTVTSDSRDKNSITDVDHAKTQAFLRRVEPKLFRLNNGQSGRLHCGVLAQELRECTAELGETSEVFEESDFAFLCHSAGYVTDNTDLPEGKKIEHRDQWSVRYAELIGFLIAGWQATDTDLANLRAEKDELELRLASLERSMVALMGGGIQSSRKRKRV